MNPRAPQRLLLAFAALPLMLAPGWSWDWSNVDVDKAASGGMKLFKAATGMSDADEIKLGREVAANLAARYGISSDAAKLRYVNLVGQTLAARSSRAKLPYHFGILKTPEFNAFAAPGGYIFVTEGLLAGLNDEAELAGVLAHEISHVTERHVAKAVREANLFGAGKDLTAAMSHDPQAWGALSDFSIQLMDKGFSRKDELEADRLGSQLAGRAGYDPRGLRDSVERLSQTRAKDGALARFNGTHPAPADRLKAIDEALKKAAPSGEPIRLADRYMKNLPR
jgi:predicted Zn-dependent protease